MKIAIILNGVSKKKKFFYQKIAPKLSKENFTVNIFETQFSGHAIELASSVVQKDFDVVLAAGGDGTLNQVLNGILLNYEEGKEIPMLGVIPLGSGNDFARTISMSAEPNLLIKKLNSANFISCDVGKIRCKDKKGNNKISYFINVADAGMGPEVVDKMMNTTRVFGAGIAYYKAILSTFFTYKPMMVSVKTDNWKWEGSLRTLAIANGKCFGHGLYIAPDAKPNDGVFNTFLAGGVTVAEFIWHSESLKRSKKINHRYVQYNQAKHFEIESPHTCAIEADGEWIGLLPASVDIIPACIKVLC